MRSLFHALVLLGALHVNCIAEANSDRHSVFLQQALLKEAVPYLSKTWDTLVVIRGPLHSVDNLSINYRPDKAVSLEEALTGICAYLLREHQVHVRWRQDGETIILEKSD